MSDGPCMRLTRWRSRFVPAPMTGVVSEAGYVAVLRWAMAPGGATG